MMNDNDRLFNKIGVDIRMWRDNAHPPRITWIWILTITFSLLNAGVWIYVYTYWWSSWWFQFTAIFVGMCLFPFLFMKIFGTLPGSWPEVLDSKLAIYKPLNIGAWQWLQSTVTERKELSLDVIQQWYEAEKKYRYEITSGKSTKTCHFRFIQNIPDSNGEGSGGRER
ncbi:hypothetical protein C2478_20580 [Salmonella enterica]|nr:hypothetical protein [Salmonella enterica]HEC6701071.1 hypothetical protein [Salmonella enterica subsp. enterica serovar Weltevreden]ECC4608475.1 hypothetical protein [Salmonella enterica]ECJ1395676.1 hypothetical protein [Salmonella enterica]ECQ9992036.1 hypothetical protein [Salmonella enterica]